MSLQRFAGQTVLLTGSTGGIGQATARRFHAEGARLVLVDLDLDGLRAQARALGPGVSIYDADVSDGSRAQAILDEVLQRHDRIDVGVLNAGIEGRIAPLEEQTVQDFDRVMAVNVRGVFVWLAGLMRAMRARQGGAITVTSSVGGLIGSRQLGPYVASKHAVVGLMKTAALEGAAAGIRVNAINPGPVATRMMDAIDSARGELLQARQRNAQAMPLGRYGTPEEVAAMIAYVSSQEAGFVTGTTLVMDGGLMAGKT